MKLIRYIDGEVDFELTSENNTTVNAILNMCTDKQVNKAKISITPRGVDIKYDNITYRIKF